MVKNLNPFNVLRGVFAIVHLFILVFIQSLTFLCRSAFLIRYLHWLKRLSSILEKPWKLLAFCPGDLSYLTVQWPIISLEKVILNRFLLSFKRLLADSIHIFL